MKLVPRMRTLVSKTAGRIARRSALAPGRYAELIDRYVGLRVRKMIEVGVWRGDRSSLFLALNPALEDYVGFDLFQDITRDQYAAESMGTCFPEQFDVVLARLHAARSARTTVTLVRGNTHDTLPAFVSSRRERLYDFALIDGGHSVETITNDWQSTERVLTEQGTCIFDDYYLERDDMGAKRLIDGLDPAVWSREFFGTIDRTVSGNFITMVAVRRHGATS
jgi:hypothetical protein